MPSVRSVCGLFVLLFDERLVDREEIRERIKDGNLCGNQIANCSRQHADKTIHSQNGVVLQPKGPQSS